MRNSLVFALLTAGLALPSVGSAHGGNFPPPSGGTPALPGDTTPSSPSGPNSPGPGTPSAPGPSDPSTPGPGTPRTPGSRAAPTTPGGSPGSPAGGPGGPRTGGSSERDETQWQYWWMFNQAPYLNLKAHIRSGGVLTGSDEYYLGNAERQNARDTLRVNPEVIRGVIVPELLSALRSESSNDIQSSCMVALAKIGDPAGENGRSPIAREIQLELQKHLTSPSQEIAETAAVALGILGTRENIEVLTAVLKNDGTRLRELGVNQLGEVSVRTRAFAAYGLGLIGHRASDYDRLVINATLRTMLDGDCKGMAHRDVPVACLTAIGLTPLPIDHREALAEASKKPRKAGILTTRQEQLAFLLAYCADRANPSLTRAHAPTAMARLLRSDDVPADFAYRGVVAKALMQSLAAESKEENSIQQSCALALGLIGDSDEDPTDKAIRAGLMRVKDQLADQQVRNFALIALAQAAGRPGEGLGDPIFGVQAIEPKDNARSFLLAELGRGNSAVRCWSGLAVAVLERSLDDAHQASSPDCKLALRACLDQAQSPDEIGAFSIACGVVKDIGARDTLLANIDEVRDVEARGFTAIGLGLMNEKSAVPAIQELVRKSKFQGELLRNSAIALGLLGDKDLVPELIEMLSSANSLSSQAAICSALGMIGDARSVDALIRLLQNREVTELARAFGAVALGIVADKEDLPWNSKIAVDSNYRANTASLTDGKGGIIDIL